MSKAPVTVFFGKDPATEEQIKVFEECSHKYCDHLEKQLSDGRKFLAGDKITIADFTIFAKIKSLTKNTSPKEVLNQNCLGVYEVMEKSFDDEKYAKCHAWVATMEAELA